MIRTMDELLEAAKNGEPGRLAVAVAQDEYVLDAVVKATELGIVVPILVGDAEEIKGILAKLEADASAYRIVDEPDKTEACMAAARACILAIRVSLLHVRTAGAVYTPAVQGVILL